MWASAPTGSKPSNRPVSRPRTTTGSAPLDYRQARAGVAFGTAAYVWWGLCALYFKALAVAGVPPVQVLAHRIGWSFVLLVLIVAWTRRFAELRAVLRQPRVLGRLCLTTLLIANNWGIFIYAVTTGELLQASLGYFINPLLNVLLGVVFLRERLRPTQTLAVLLATVAVGWMVMRYGQVPWIALILAASFGFYGLIRKTAPVGPILGLTIETGLLAPAAVVYLLYCDQQGSGCFLHGGFLLDLLLASAGLITALPLIWFTAAAKRLRYATLGFLQYLAPTGQFLLAVLAFGEPFTRQHAVTFGLIWIALAIYSAETIVHARRRATAVR